MVPCCGGILINQDGDKVSRVTHDTRVRRRSGRRIIRSSRNERG
jgi:hypothetical protein